MSDDDHKQNAKPPLKFCSERIAGKCKPHDNDYTKHKKPNWKRFPQKYRIFEEATGKKKKKRKQIGTGVRYLGHNAHHILCAASVGEFIVDTEIRPSVDLTDWCVNKAENIKALPLWGQWFQYYVNQLGGDLKDDPEPASPTFIDRPMHNYDHYKYQRKELDPKLQQIAADIKSNNKSHEDSAKDLAAALDDLIEEFSSELDYRGERKGGTHAAWVKALKDSTFTDWYQPFSMAADPTPMEFPIQQTSNVWNKIRKWLEAIGATAP